MEIGKWLMIVGCFILLAGAFIWFGNRVGIPFGQMPGDISVKGEKYAFYFPIVTSIVVSVILTIVINVVISLMRK